ncbi:RNA-directed DNA polymerase, eukaryota, partial [Tanacetum coccineum]
GQLHWIAVKELEAWMPKFSIEEEEDSSSHDESENNNGNDFGLDNEHELDHVSETTLRCCVGANVEGDKPDNNSQLDFNMSSNNDKIQNDRGVGNYGMKFQESGSILEVMDELIKALWRNSSFDYAFSPSIGYSRGILCVWDPRLFVKDNSMVLDSFLAISDSWDGECILLGDFNEVIFDHERHGSLFNSHGANAFNNFINMAGLIDLPLEGYSFTWAHKSASKMSKLDRIFISEALCLDKHLSDHRPILLRELNVDYGPTSFRFFHSWSSKKGFDKMVENSWKNSDVQESNSIIRLKKKLKSLKSSIKLCLVEDKLKKGRCTDDLIQERSYLLKELQAINKANSLDMAQKAKIRWAVEGDENSKFFHGIINKKCSQLAIRGVLVDGDWVVDPSKVKNEFLNRFTASVSSSITFDYQFPKRLSSDQIDDLERIVSYDDIKSVVWDCGTNKSPCPDGFTFEFYRKYWNIIDHDVVAAFTTFFSTCLFPHGCNSSFIALIPKSHEAKMTL